MATESDWDDVADDIRAWIELRHPTDLWCKWVRLVKKKSIEHYREIIKNDFEYQAMLSAAGADAADAALTTVLTSKRLGSKKQKKTDRHLEVKQKQDARLKAAFDTHSKNAFDSNVASSAKAAAILRNSVHGRAAALKAGVLASAKVLASEELQRHGVDSVNEAAAAARKRSRTYTPPPLPQIKFELMSTTLKLAGVEEFKPNPLGLNERMDIHQLSNVLRDTVESTRVVFQPLTSASASVVAAAAAAAAAAAVVKTTFPSYQLLSSDPLGDSASNEERMARVRQCCYLSANSETPNRA